jgi:hypothetical protein
MGFLTSSKKPGQPSGSGGPPDSNRSHGSSKDSSDRSKGVLTGRLFGRRGSSQSPKRVGTSEKQPLVEGTAESEAGPKKGSPTSGNLRQSAIGGGQGTISSKNRSMVGLSDADRAARAATIKFNISAPPEASVDITGIYTDRSHGPKVRVPLCKCSPANHRRLPTQLPTPPCARAPLVCDGRDAHSQIA